MFVWGVCLGWGVEGLEGRGGDREVVGRLEYIYICVYIYLFGLFAVCGDVSCLVHAYLLDH